MLVLGGNDTFFLNNLNPTAPIWSTLLNFHAGDAATGLPALISRFLGGWKRESRI
jgi:hypothetical protein